MSKKKTAPAKLAKTFVYVACKAPLGLFTELGVKGQPGYRKMLIKGANEGHFNPRDGRFTATTLGGFGLTEVPAEYWAEWRKTREAFVAEWEAGKLLSVHDSKDEADAWRIENADSVTGFEPLDPSKMPKGLEAAPTGHAV
jgi:hypothetical protein